MLPNQLAVNPSGKNAWSTSTLQPRMLSGLSSGERLRRESDLERDLRELVGGLADLAQERQPARVGVDAVEEVHRHDLGQAGVFFLHSLIEPLERLVRLTAEGVDVGDVERGVLLILRDQR